MVLVGGRLVGRAENALRHALGRPNPNPPRDQLSETDTRRSTLNDGDRGHMVRSVDQIRNVTVLMGDDLALSS
jgi:hypothetical protein